MCIYIYIHLNYGILDGGGFLGIGHPTPCPMNRPEGPLVGKGLLARLRISGAVGFAKASEALLVYMGLKPQGFE